MGRVLCFVLLLSGWSPGADQVVQHTRRQNLIRLTLDDGVADFEWISSGAFRFSRSWNRDAAAAMAASNDSVEFRLSDTAGELALETRHLKVRIAKNALRLFVDTHEGKPLILESSPIRRSGSSLILERQLPAGEFF